MPEKPLSQFEQRALPQAKLGYRIIPLEGKSPEINGKNWPVNATSDEGKIAEFGKKSPDANSGIVAQQESEPDDYYMADIDNASWFMEAAQEHGLKLDFHAVVQSGSGYGFHIYIAGKKPAWAKTVKNPKYISKEETPNEKPALLEFPQMVVGPGSVHPKTGRLYKPLEEPFGKPQVLSPEFIKWWQSLYGAVTSSPGTLRSRPLKPGTSLREVLDGTELKGRYEITESGDKVFYCYHSQLGRCLVKGAPHRDGGNNRTCGFYHMKQDSSDWGHFCLAAACQMVEGGQRKAALAALGLTLEDVLRPKWRDQVSDKSELDQKPLSFVVDRFVPEEGITGIGGQSGHGKTWLMLSMAKSISTGEKLWGIINVKQYPIIYMLAEGGDRSLNKRLNELNIGKSEDFLVRTMSKGKTLALDDHDTMAMSKGRVTFFDTLPRWLSGRNENAAQEMAELFQLGLNLLSNGAVAIVMAQHSVKPSAKTPWTMTQECVFRGSGDIVANMASAHGVYQLDNQARDRTLLHIECVKPRDFDPLLPFQLEGKPWINSTGDFRCFKEPGSCGWFREERKAFVDGTKDKSPEDALYAKIQALEKAGKIQKKIADELDISVATITRLKRKAAEKAKAAEVEEDVDNCSTELFPEGEME